MIIKNKKGGDKVLSLYWIIILILIAGGVFGMVYTFYKHPYDVREIENGILINKFSDCISYGGKINQNLLSGDNFNQTFEDFVSEECNLDFGSGEEYYVEANFYSENNLNLEVYSLSYGNSGLVASCNIQEDKEYGLESKCSDGEFFSLSESGNLYLVKVNSIIKKTEQNSK